MTSSHAGTLALRATHSSSPDTIVDPICLRNTSWTIVLRTKMYLAISSQVPESSLPGLDISILIQLAPHLSSENCLSTAVIWSSSLVVRCSEEVALDSARVGPSMIIRWALSSCKTWGYHDQHAWQAWTLTRTSSTMVLMALCSPVLIQVLSEGLVIAPLIRTSTAARPSCHQQWDSKNQTNQCQSEILDR
jgi:hypothetical protein